MIVKGGKVFNKMRVDLVWTLERNSFMITVVRHWNRLPTEAVHALALFKASLNRALSNLLW